MTAAIQTTWCDLIARTLAEAGVTTCVVSPGSRSTPLVAALAAQGRLELVPIIDERAAAFFALGVARATGVPAALVCTSGTAGAHYLPAIIEASMAAVPMIAITADRPPELHDCGAAQTIDQVRIYGEFVRGAFELGAPVGTAAAARAVLRKLVQAVTLARGPHPGPVHLEVPLRKPLEPAAPSTDEERAFARVVAELSEPTIAPPARLTADALALDQLAKAITAEPEGVIVVGALSAQHAIIRDRVFAVARASGYPVLAEASSQLRFGARPSDVTLVDQFDLVPPVALPHPRLVLQLGAEPVAASWPAMLAAANPSRWVLADHRWHDPDSAARGVIIGDLAGSLDQLRRTLAARTSSSWQASWAIVRDHAAEALEQAIAEHPRSETAAMRAAIEAAPQGALLQIGNSLPIRVIDHVPGGGVARTVLTQRGAAGIDGLIASAAGATRAGRPVLLVLGDVSFAHDLGGLLAARSASAPLAVVVLDNRGGQIFAGLPIAKAGLGPAYERLFVTAPELDPAAVATALGARSITAGSPAAVGTAVASALATPGVTIIHAPVSVSGARDVRRTAIELYRSPVLRSAHGGTT